MVQVQVESKRRSWLTSIDIVKSDAGAGCRQCIPPAVSLNLAERQSKRGAKRLRSMYNMQSGHKSLPAK